MHLAHTISANNNYCIWHCSSSYNDLLTLADGVPCDESVEGAAYEAQLKARE